MRRRNLARFNNKNPWQSKCNYARALQSPTQAFYSNLLSHWVLAAPPPVTFASSEAQSSPTEKQNRFWLDKNELKWQSSKSSSNTPYEINNDGKINNKPADDIINVSKIIKKKKQRTDKNIFCYYQFRIIYQQHLIVLKITYLLYTVILNFVWGLKMLILVNIQQLLNILN